jgi:hypothetical protein
LDEAGARFEREVEICRRGRVVFGVLFRDFGGGTDAVGVLGFGSWAELPKNVLQAS